MAKPHIAENDVQKGAVSENFTKKKEQPCELPLENIWCGGRNLIQEVTNCLYAKNKYSDQQKPQKRPQKLKPTNVFMKLYRVLDF
jgi:hypothetical protein